MSDANANLRTAELMLKQSGLKRTPVRIGVLQVLANQHDPLDVTDILKQLPTFTEPVTVYRTLNTFVEKKIIHRVRGEDRSWRYAAGDTSISSNHQHAHFVCDSCGKMECLADARLPLKLLEKIQPAPGYKVDHPEVIIHGTCPKCI